ALVNILRVRIDACDRLWAVDSGIDDILDVDPKNCSDAYVYNSDLGGYGLVVYSMAKNDSWRINHNYFYFDPLNGEYNVSGIHFQWTDGMFGMALSPPKEDGSKTLYFHSMSGIHEFAVSTSLIKNQTALADPKYWTQFHVVGNKGPLTQGTSSMCDLETGIIYFTQLNKNAVACWDTKMDLNPDNFRIVAQDNEKLVFPNDIIIEPKTRKFYCLSDNLPVLQYSEYDVNQTNFYIHVASLDDLTTACRAKAE
ncbi:hypothetical protein G9C98_007384, partial [Cotesia typhae]